MFKRIIAFIILVMMFLLNIGSVIINNKNNQDDNKIQETDKSHIDLYAGISKFLYKDINNAYEKLKKIISITGWTNDTTYLKSKPQQDSKNLCTIPFNAQIEYFDSDDEWLKVKYDEKIGYIKREYISDTKCSYNEYFFPYNTGFKSYLPYNKITHTESKQYKLQKYAYTGTYGIRQVNGRFCIAVGTAFNTEIGDYADLILSNGEIIPVVISDIKADIHTNSDNITTSSNGCVSEFLVDMSVLHNEIKTGGNISLCNENWNSSVAALRVYEKNILIWD